MYGGSDWKSSTLKALICRFCETDGNCVTTVLPPATGHVDKTLDARKFCPVGVFHPMLIEALSAAAPLTAPGLTQVIPTAQTIAFK